MKSKKLLRKLDVFIGTRLRKQRRHREELEALLAKLQQKEQALEAELQGEQNMKKRERISRKRETIRDRRAKGVAFLQTLQDPDPAGTR